MIMIISRSRLIEQLEILDKVFISSEWDSFQGYMYTITNIIEFLNDQFDIAMGKKNSMNFTSRLNISSTSNLHFSPHSHV